MLKRVTLFVFLGLIFSLPLFFFPWAMDMYEVPKNILLKVGVSLLCVLYLLEEWDQKKFTLYLGKSQAIWVLAFLGILALSYLFAYRPHISFWGDYVRQGGIYNMLNYVLLFLVSLKFLQKKEDRERVFKVTSVVGVVLSMYAVLQSLGVDIFPEQVTDVFAGRSFATMGNPTSLGAFLLFPIWTQAYFLLEGKVKSRTNNLFGLALMLIALVLTKNRGSILALFASAFLYFLHKFRARKKLLAGICSIGIILFIAFIGIYGKDMRSIHSRISIWKSSVEIIQESPILGYGMESFDPLFQTKVRPDFFQTEDYRNLADRPHNEFLEMWIHLGLAGLLFYIGLIGFVLRRFFTSENSIQRFACLAVLSLFATNFFSFSLTIHYSFLTVFLALILAHDHKKISWNNNTGTKLMTFMLLILMSLNILISGRVLSSTIQMRLGVENILSGDLSKGVEQVDRGIQLAPMYNQSFQEGFNIYYSLALNIEDPELNEYAKKMNEISRLMTREDLNSSLDHATLLILNGDSESAEAAFRGLSERGHISPVFYEEWANFYFDENRALEASVLYDELFKIMPNYWAAPILTEGPMDENQRIFWKNHPDFLSTILNAIETYKAVGETEFATALENSIY
jgi:O-antigen ligase